MSESIFCARRRTQPLTHLIPSWFYFIHDFLANLQDVNTV